MTTTRKSRTRQGLTQSVNLTNAQLLALPTTPIVLVPTPPAGFLIMAPYVFFNFFWVADVTGIDANAYFAAVYGSTGISILGYLRNDNPQGSKLAELIAAGGNGQATMVPYTTTVVAPNYTTGTITSDDTGLLPAGQALNLKADNALDFTGGNVGNVLRVVTQYDLLDLN